MLVLGCDGCPDRKPYTPYTITGKPSASDAGDADAQAAQAADVDAGADAAAPPSFAVVNAEHAEGDGSSWTFGDPKTTVNAPAGRQFSLGFVLDADGDGSTDLIAWAKAPDGQRGELVFVPGRAPSTVQTVFALPADVSARGCESRTSLSQVGPRALLFDVGTRMPCGSKKTASRWAAVVRFGKQSADAAPKAPELALEVRVGALQAGEEVSVSAETPDIDGDGRDDIRARLTLVGTFKPFSGAVGPYPSVPNTSAAIAFFDRPAGLSRDPSEPEASMALAAAETWASAKKKDTAPSVFAAAHQLRRLHSLLCSGSSAAAVSTSAGPIDCGAPRSLEENALGEAQAAFTLGDPIRAFAAVARFDGLPSPSDAHKRDMANLIARHAPKAKVSLVYRAQTAPLSFEPPSYAPISFDAGGDLLVASENALTRIDRGTLAESQATQSVWPKRLTTGAGDGSLGHALKRVEQRCDSAVLIAVFQEADLADGDPSAKPSEVLLPIVASVNAHGFPAFERCAALPSIPVVPYGDVPELGLLFAVGSELVAVKKQGASQVASLVKWPLPPPLEEHPVAAGAARSPEGATVVVNGGRGRLVTSMGGSSKLWASQDMDANGVCVPSTGGARIACAANGAAVILEAK